MARSSPLKPAFIKIGWIIAIYVLSTSYFVTLTYLYLGFSKGTNRIDELIPNYVFTIELMTSAIFSVIGGLIFGGLEVFYFSRHFRRKSYKFIMMVKACIYFCIAFLIGCLAAIHYNSSVMGLPMTHPDVLAGAKAFLSSSGLLYLLSLVMMPTLLMIIFIQIDEKMGQGVMWQLFTGKFHHPKEQSRIFMFLDMRASTTIAEKLGHAKFYDLLNHFFADMTNPILTNRGEIYQYVGDEIIISWNIKNGIESARCIQCFFDIKKSILENAKSYEKAFGVIPEFKAGMHFGQVTTGEVGVIKREITHSGDVLNTAARIQSRCNELGCDFIISKSLKDVLNLNGQFAWKNLGELELKGKENKVSLIAVDLKENFYNQN